MPRASGGRKELIGGGKQTGKQKRKRGSLASCWAPWAGTGSSLRRSAPTPGPAASSHDPSKLPKALSLHIPTESLHVTQSRFNRESPGKHKPSTMLQALDTLMFRENTPNLLPAADCKPFPSKSREAGYGSDLPRTRVLQGGTDLTVQNLDSVSKQKCVCGDQCTSQQELQ